LLCSKDGGAVEASKFLASFWDLLRVNVIPIYIEVESNNDDKRMLAGAIILTSFRIWSNFIMCGLCDENVIGLATDLTKMFFNESSASLHVELAQLVFHILDHIGNHGISAECGTLLRPWFEQVSECASLNRESFGGLSDLNRLIVAFQTFFTQDD